MPEPIEELYVSIGADVAPLLRDTEKGVDKAEGKLKRLSNTGKKAFAGIGSAVVKFTAVLGGAAVALTGLLVTVNKLTDAYIKQAKAEAQVAATLRSTGNAAGLTDDELKKLASDLQNVTNIGDEVTLTAEAMLLTFKNIGRDIFPHVTEAVLDVATAMNSGATPGAEQLRTQAILLGKALNDPIKGMAGLQRNGIQFTESQKDQIKTLAEAGRITEAQTIILKELESQFGGSARAARAADQGFEAAANTIGDSYEKLGRQLIPLREGYVSLLTALAGKSDETGGIVTDVLAGIAAGAVALVATVKAAFGELQKEFTALGKVATAAISLDYEGAKAAFNDYTESFKAGQDVILSFGDTFNTAFDQIKSGWEEQRKAAEEAAAAGATPAGLIPGVDEINTMSEEAQNALRDAGRDFIDLQEETNKELEANQKEHVETMAQIEEDGAKERVEINEKYDKELVKEQQDIIEGAKEDLKKLQEDTDRDLAKRRKDANKDELRETEDHLTDMRRLRLNFLDNLEDAVRDRDAGRVRDLQRQFQRESQERQQDFDKKRTREQQDTDEELNEVRNREQMRAQEIIDSRTKALADVEQRVQESRARDLQNLDEKLAAEREKENTRFMERQTELENALNLRLETLAKELSDMEDLESESAQRILETLNEYFGAGGNIDQLMNDFETRRKKTLTLQIGFEADTNSSTPAAAQAALAQGRAFRGGSRVPSFATGGTLLATSPTLAQFGEVPELVQFTPLSKMGSMGGGGQSMDINLKLSGSAPPGIRSGDRDAIAGVLVNALREAGVNAKPGR